MPQLVFSRTCMALALSVLGLQAHAAASIYFDGTTPYMKDGTSLIFDGVRQNGGGIDFNDALRFEYKFDASSQDFLLKSKKLYRNIGVFDAAHMSLNVSPVQPAFKVDGLEYQSAQTYSFSASAGKPFVATYQLEPGHVMSWFINAPSSKFAWRFYGPGVDNVARGEAGQGIISYFNRILVKGTYRLKIVPEGSDTVSFSLKIFNANNRPLTTIVDGTIVSDTFVFNIRDYSKYRVRLKAGQVLALPKPSDSNIRFQLLNTLGATVADFRGLALRFKAVKTGTYYLFIENQNGWGSGYRGTASITETGLQKLSDDGLPEASTDAQTSAPAAAPAAIE